MRTLMLVYCITLCQFAISQNRAPSCWLKYQDDFQGDILINKVKVKSPSPTYTYFCNLQWNAGLEGGGYCGMQEHPDGRNFIFSIWDPISSTESITAPYTHPGTLIESFGGEGTGLKSWNFDIGWNPDQWYSFVTRSWSNGSNTLFGFWVYSHADQIWYHLVTMDYPVSDIRFDSRTGSFIEDWLGNGWNTREVHHQAGWKRKSADLSWVPLTSSIFERVSPDPGANNYINNYDGGTKDDYYFMQSGGTISPVNNTSASMLSLSSNKQEPEYDVAVVSDLVKTLSGDSLLLNWSIDSSKSPQFAYSINIYDNPAFSGDALIEISENIPHQRSHIIDISSLIDGAEYYLNFSVIDIFDKQSVQVNDSFIPQSITVGLDKQNVEKTFECYPNPFDNSFLLKFKNKNRNTNVSLIDITGNSVLNIDFYNRSIIEIEIPPRIGKGFYFLTVTDEYQNNKTIKLIKK